MLESQKIDPEGKLRRPDNNNGDIDANNDNNANSAYTMV